MFVVTHHRTYYSLILVAGPGGAREAIYCHSEIKCSQVGFLVKRTITGFAFSTDFAGL